jgi:hypothetical protein
MANDKSKPKAKEECRLCDRPTTNIFNIGFSAVRICEQCAEAIFIQQAQWYVKNKK